MTSLVSNSDAASALSAEHFVLRHQSDLDPHSRAHPAVVSWCREQQHVVALQDGTILTDQPASRLVQNCQLVMEQQGIPVTGVRVATHDLIQTLLENIPTKTHEHAEGVYSDQQRRLRRLVKEALSLQATDIHLEVRAQDALLRFRRHGELFLQATWQAQMAQELACVAFNKETDQSGMHFNPRVPQNAAMPLTIEGRRLRLRLASLPAHGGYDVVMRLLPEAEASITPLSDLGYTPAQLAELKAIIAEPQGAVLVAGPTGSGKTTTLASCMQIIPDYRKIITIEDPVERLIPNATQVPVSIDHADRDFANMTRTALRMDPDVMVIGEMRDSTTASLMMRAALTGHLVFSTVHANTAIDIVRRLEDLGVPRSLMASQGIIAALVSQRLVPLLCTYCSETYDASSVSPEQWQRLCRAYGEHPVSLRRRGKGCDHCEGCGLSGRTVVADIVRLDDVAEECIAQGHVKAWREHLRQKGHRSLWDHAREHVLAGRCDPADIDRVIGHSLYQTEVCS